MAEFYTSLTLEAEDEDDDVSPSDAEEEPGAPRPFNIPRGLDPAQPFGAYWLRESLFNGTRGEIGLAWSIFKIRGTPTPNNWPVRFPFLRSH